MHYGISYRQQAAQTTNNIIGTAAAHQQAYEVYATIFQGQ